MNQLTGSLHRAVLGPLCSKFNLVLAASISRRGDRYHSVTELVLVQSHLVELLRHVGPTHPVATLALSWGEPLSGVRAMQVMLLLLVGAQRFASVDHKPVPTLLCAFSKVPALQ